jgi:MtN3 and saliva related transmembrane protein
MTVLADVALVAGLVTAVAPFAQARRILRRRSSDDVSLTWLGLYAGGCLVWVGYGISIGSVPLVVSQSVAAAGSAVATFLTVRWRQPAVGRSVPAPPVGERRGGSGSASVRVEDVMLPSPSVISEELVVEEARRHFTAGLVGALPVVDHTGCAVGVVHAADIGALPPLARASCLVAPLVDRDPDLLAETAADAGEVLGREAVARTGFAMVTNRRCRLVGVAWYPPPRPSGEEQSCSSAAFASTSLTTPT